MELLLTAVPVKTKDFTWNSSLNFSYNKNEVKRITDDINEFILETARTGHDGDNCGPAFIYHEVGEPYGIIKGESYKRNDKGEIMFDDNGLPMKGGIKKLGESVAPYTLGFSNSFKAVVNYCVAKRSLFSIIDSLSKAFAWFASFLSTVTTTLNQFK